MAQVKIQDSKGDAQGEFNAGSDESIGTQAQDHGIDIPFSCGVGACRTCIAKVKSGNEHLNPEAVGPQYIDLEEEEILTCIAAVKEDAPSEATVELEVENL